MAGNKIRINCRIEKCIKIFLLIYFIFNLFLFFSLISVPPLSLLLQGLNHALVAGTRTHVTCTAVGARPAPQIIWSKGGQILKGATQSVGNLFRQMITKT